MHLFSDGNESPYSVHKRMKIKIKIMACFLALPFGGGLEGALKK
jgi:hypothetical protein